MRHAHFLVLTGRLSEFPLHELIETLRGQRKTGRLQVEFQAGPASFYFREGALVEARMGELRDLEALSLALSLQNEDSAAFNFNPLVGPQENGNARPLNSERTAAYAREVTAHARVRVLDVEGEELTHSPEAAASVQHGRANAHVNLGGFTATPVEGRQPARALPPAPDEGALFEKLERIEDAVAAQARRANFDRAAYAAVVILLVLAALFWRGLDGARTDEGRTAAAVATAPSQTEPHGPGVDASPPALPAFAEDPKSNETQPAASDDTAGVARSAGRGAEKPVPRHERRPAQNAPAQPTKDADGGATRAAVNEAGHTVQVRMSVERGRVLRAEVSNPRPGMAAYEALALRLARQRRFPEEFSGQETLSLKVRQ